MKHDDTLPQEPQKRADEKGVLRGALHAESLSFSCFQHPHRKEKIMLRKHSFEPSTFSGTNFRPSFWHMPRLM